MWGVVEERQYRAEGRGLPKEQAEACYKSASDFFLSCGCFEFGERPDPHQTQVSNHWDLKRYSRYLQANNMRSAKIATSGIYTND